ncbi:MAG TPA: hypothetical protein PKY30_23240, partial [Myxococcota bacterium]|nr:hypothetical protein [Myxococcota bacterium]
MSEFAGATWRHRLETLIATLQSNSGITLIDAQIAPPATEAQIAAATAAAGFELSPAFLAYFRSANGCRISWVERAESSRDAAIATWRQFRQEGGTFGAIDIPPIEVLCARPAHPSFGGGSPGYQLPVLGGWEDSELRLALRDFDRIDALLGQDETPFRGIAMVLHPRFPTPVLLMTEDSGAALADRWPMDACSYLELVALDGGTRLKESWFKAEGYAANHPIISFSRAELGDCFQGSNDWDERFRQMEREQR